MSSLVLLGGGVTLISVSALSDHPSDGSQLTYGGTSVVVATFPTLNVRSVSLTAITVEINWKVDTDFETNFYYVSSCSNLHVTNDTENETIIVEVPSEPQPLKEIRYFLKGSILSYNICSATNNTHAQENKHINFYILNNLREATVDIPPPYDHFVHHKQLNIGYNESVSSQNEPDVGWKCFFGRDLSYTIKDHGYYPVIIVPPLKPPENTLIKYWYQANIMQKEH